MESCRNCERGIKLVLLEDVPEIVKTGKAKVSIFCMLADEMIPAHAFNDPCEGWVKDDRELYAHHTEE